MRITAIICLLLTGLVQAAGLTPGSYTHLSWPSTSLLRTFEDYTITITSDPGPTSNIFWSNQFSIGNYIGYTGMQSTETSNDTLAGKLFLVSIWGATDSKPGSNGSSCGPFTEGSAGQTCRYLYEWQPNHTYNFHLSADGGSWFSVTVSDVTDKTSPITLFNLGSIYLPNAATNIMPGLVVQWTEYFEWGDPRAVCQDAPYSSVIFSASSGSISPTITSTNPSNTCQCYTDITCQSNSSISTQSNGIGNSARANFKMGGLCLNAQYGLFEGAKAILYPCGNFNNELFVYASDKTIRSQSDYCLTLVDANTVTFNSCANLVTQKWHIADGQIISKSTRTYLVSDANNNIVTSNTPSNYYWTVPQRIKKIATNARN